jgi:glycine/D-amino acid oxidase-like deaminating enzyme
MIGHTRSLWRATAELPKCDRLEHDLDVDVAIVGAGTTGLTTALLLTRAGYRVAVLERRGIGAGTTGGTTAKVTALQGLVYSSLIDGVGVERSRVYAEANVAGTALAFELAGDFAPDCEATPADTFTFGWDSSAHRDLVKEHEAATAAGLQVELVNAANLPLGAVEALRDVVP